MMIGLICLLFLWNIFGFMVYATILTEVNPIRREFFLFDPRVIYDLWNVNYVGCTLLTILFNLLCPIMSIV